MKLLVPCCTQDVGSSVVVTHWSLQRWKIMRPVCQYIQQLFNCGHVVFHGSCATAGGRNEPVLVAVLGLKEWRTTICWWWYIAWYISCLGCYCTHVTWHKGNLKDCLIGVQLRTSMCLFTLKSSEISTSACVCVARWDTICVACHNGIVHSHQLCSMENAFTYTWRHKKLQLFKNLTNIEEIQEKKIIDRNWTIATCLLRDSNPNYQCLKITSCRWRPPPRMLSFTATTHFKSSHSFVSPCVCCMLCRMRQSLVYFNLDIFG